jgi:hypothetical protein
MLFLHRSALPALCLSLLFTSAFSVQAADAPAPAAEKPVERQPLPERSQEEANALERQLPQQEQQQLQAGSDSFLALWKPANSAEPQGVVIIVPGAGESADWPQAIAPLRSKLPDADWGTLSLSLPDVNLDTLPPRVMEAPKAAVDTSSKEGSTAAKPIEQAASAEAEGTDPAVVPGAEQQEKTDAKRIFDRSMGQVAGLDPATVARAGLRLRAGTQALGQPQRRLSGGVADSWRNRHQRTVGDQACLSSPAQSPPPGQDRRHRRQPRASARGDRANPRAA